jgi:aminoglycoside/choline kinase family phosphotransferase
MDRLKQLTQWVQEQQPNKRVEVVPLAGDASFRRYYRVTDGNDSWIVMDADPTKEKNEAYLSVGHAFAEGGVTVPIVFSSDKARGFFLISDFGDTLLLDILKQETANDLYTSAFDTLIKIQRVKSTFPSFNNDMYNTELKLFDDWYLQRLLRINLPSKELAQIYGVYELLIKNGLSQPQICVHRDYHSRNLMQLSNGQLGVIDFQDAVIGPVGYDLTSLLRDSYVDWPQRQVNFWISEYYDRAKDAKILSQASLSQFTLWFDWIGMQRHLKNLGIFSRLNIRDNKPQYLQYMPRMLTYLIDVASQYPEFSPLVTLLQRIREDH